MNEDKRLALEQEMKEGRPYDQRFPRTVFLRAKYNQSDAVILFKDNGEIVTKAEFDWMAERCNAYFATHDDQTIEADNQTFLEQEEDRRRKHEEDMRQRIKPKRQKQPGFVYLLYAPSGHYKIGRAKDITERVKQLNTQPPFDIQIVHSIPSDDYIQTEQILHYTFADKRVNNTEWFALDKADVNYIKCQASYSDGAFNSIHPDRIK